MKNAIYKYFLILKGSLLPLYNVLQSPNWGTNAHRKTLKH